jgi:hypothetical protein
MRAVTSATRPESISTSPVNSPGSCTAVRRAARVFDDFHGAVEDDVKGEAASALDK